MPEGIHWITSHASADIHGLSAPLKMAAAEQQRQAARQLASQGNDVDAKAGYLLLLALSPDDVEALNYLSMCALAQNDTAKAIELLQTARAAHPDETATLKNLGIALMQNGDAEQAMQVLQDAVAREPGFFVARLYLGVALERLGRKRESLTTYFKAVSAAQSQGYWLGDSTTPVGLRITVRHATQMLYHGRRQILSGVMHILHGRFGHNAMIRVERCLARYLGTITIPPAHPRQKPSFLNFPDIPATPYFEKSLFPWYAELEDRTDAIRADLQRALREGSELQPFLGHNHASAHDGYLGGTNQDIQPRWDGFFFHRHGQRHDDHCDLYPNTALALDATTLARVPGHAPEALYSVLGAGSHIRPHFGVTNTRAVTHLPLIVPEHCTLRVAGEDHHWREGHCVTFDDTFEHEAWNKSTRTRVILLFDVWNPYLTDAEQSAITDLVVAIGELNGETLLT